MAQAGEPLIGTAEETLAQLRAHPEYMVQTSFPSAGVDLYVGYFPECGHYAVRVVTFGEDPTDRYHVRITESELSEMEVLWRMHALMQADIDADPAGYAARMALEEQFLQGEG